MPAVHINLLAVLVAAVVNMIIGALWYSPLLFSKLWMREVGKKMEDIGQSGPAYALTMVGALVAAYVLAHFVAYAQAVTLMDGVKTGFWAWLGFVVPTHGATHLFEGKSLNLYLITIGYHLVALMVMGGILAVWV